MRILVPHKKSLKIVKTNLCSFLYWFNTNRINTEITQSMSQKTGSKDIQLFQSAGTVMVFSMTGRGRSMRNFGI